jgi:hypothetical protein
VKRLPYADHIICLDQGGKVLEQGSFADLSAAGGYVASFSLPSPDWNYNSNHDDADSDDDLVVVPRDEHVPDVVLAHEHSARTAQGSGSASFTGSDDTTHDDPEKEPTRSRQTGDMQIYLYYVRAVGWWPSMVFIAAITGFVFCISFPSESLLLGDGVNENRRMHTDNGGR